jgi:outer membrane lipoprotein SlyB
MRGLIVCTALLTIQSCASTDGVGKYETKSIGQVDRTVLAEVVAVESISLRDATTGGALAGGTIGGLAASGSDDPTIILAGILAGAVVGAVLEDPLNTHQAILYTLTTQNGATLKVAKLAADGPKFVEGQRVAVRYGYPAKMDPIDSP